MPPDLLAQAIALRRRCWTHERIAEELGVPRSAVSRLLSAHDRRSLKRLDRRSSEARIRQVGQLEWVAQEAADAWERSKLDARTVKVTEPAEDGSGKGRTAGKTETTTALRSGDAAFLRETRAALTEIRKLLGIDRPPKTRAGRTYDDIPDDEPDVEPRHDPPAARLPDESGPLQP